MDFVQHVKRGTSKGVEFEMTLRPTTGLRLSTGLDYNKAGFGSFHNAVDFDGLGTTTPDGTRGEDGLAGTRVVVVPRTFGVRLAYRYR